MRWELGGMPSHTNQHYISAGPFLGGFLFNRRLPSLSPGLPRPGLFIVCGDRELSGSAVHVAEWHIGDTAVSARIDIMDPGAA